MNPDPQKAEAFLDFVHIWFFFSLYGRILHCICGCSDGLCLLTVVFEGVREPMQWFYIRTIDDEITIFFATLHWETLFLSCSNICTHSLLQRVNLTYPYFWKTNTLWDALFIHSFDTDLLIINLSSEMFHKVVFSIAQLFFCNLLHLPTFWNVLLVSNSEWAYTDQPQPKFTWWFYCFGGQGWQPATVQFQMHIMHTPNTPCEFNVVTDRSIV